MFKDSINDIGAAAQLAGTLFKVLTAGAAAIQHFRGSDIMNAAADRTVGVQVQIGERAERRQIDDTRM